MLRIALFGKLTLEEAMDLSQYTLLLEVYSVFVEAEFVCKISLSEIY
jgi:hypothetical protein